MPPVPAALVAVQFLIFGSRTPMALWSALTVRCIGLAASVYLLLRCFGDGTRYRWRYVAALAYVAAIGALPDFFLDLHDIWLVCLVGLALVRCFAPLLEGSRDVPRAPLLLLSVVAPLTNPAFLTPFLAMWAVVLLRPAAHNASGPGDARGGPAPRRPVRLAAASLGLFLGAVLAWSALTALRVGVIAPVKSNMWYDFYQANVLEGDGVLRVSTFYRYHPIHSSAALDRYVREGERDFMARYRDASLGFLRRHPLEFLAKVARRASNAFVFLRPGDDVWDVDTGAIEEGDVACLAAAGTIALDRHQSTPGSPLYVWTNLSESPERFRHELAWLDPSGRSSILEVWNEARARVAEFDSSLLARLQGFGLAAVPAVALLLGAATRRVREDGVFTIAALFYVCFLAPYVLVSHYARYQMFMLGIQALLVPFGFVAGWSLCRQIAGRAQ